MGEALIVAGIGSRKGVSAAEVVAAVKAALKEHGLERSALTKLATTEFKRGEAGIFEAGKMMGLEVVVVDKALSSSGLSRGSAARRPAITGDLKPASPQTSADSRDKPEDDDMSGRAESSLSFKLAGVSSVSEASALAAAGTGARLAGPRIAVGKVTCAIAFGAEQ